MMDRLGPPRQPAKRVHSSPDTEEERHAKRRVVNLLEESSFPPRRGAEVPPSIAAPISTKPVASKVTASVPPGKKLEVTYCKILQTPLEVPDGKLCLSREV